MTNLQSTIEFISDADRATLGQSITARRIISLDLLLAAMSSELSDAGYTVDPTGQITGTNDQWFPLISCVSWRPGSESAVQP